MNKVGTCWQPFKKWFLIIPDLFNRPNLERPHFSDVQRDHYQGLKNVESFNLNLSLFLMNFQKVQTLSSNSHITSMSLFFEYIYSEIRPHLTGIIFSVPNYHQRYFVVDVYEQL